MKQHITKEQWDELTKKQKNVLDDYGCKEDWRMNIGQMIWFLGDDLESIFNNRSSKKYRVVVSIIESGKLKEFETFTNKELVSALWQAVKYKLGE